MVHKSSARTPAAMTINWFELTAPRVTKNSTGSSTPTVITKARIPTMPRVFIDSRSVLQCGDKAAALIQGVRIKAPTSRRTPNTLLGNDEAAQRVAKERFGSIGIPIPWPVLISDDLHRHHDATRSQAVSRADSRVDQFAVWTHGELCGARQFPVFQDLDLVFPGILIHLEIHRVILGLSVPDRGVEGKVMAAV